jgi:hypothetical protein
MADTGLKEFRQMLANFRELGSLAVKGTVALPLLNVWLKFGPPPAAAMAVCTSALQFSALMWTFHFWHGEPKKNLDRRMRVCAVLFVLGLLASGILLERFTVRPGPNRERVVKGYVVRSDVQPLIGPNFDTTMALQAAGYDPEQVWTASSITTIYVLLAASWVIAFVSIAMFISGFLLQQREPPAAAIPPRG